MAWIWYVMLRPSSLGFDSIRLVRFRFILPRFAMVRFSKSLLADAPPPSPPHSCPRSSAPPSLPPSSPPSLPLTHVGLHLRHHGRVLVRAGADRHVLVVLRRADTGGHSRTRIKAITRTVTITRARTRTRTRVRTATTTRTRPRTRVIT